MSLTPSSVPVAGSAPQHLVVMGVAGCGKSSLAQAVARHMGWRLHEGDDYHSAENVRKMRAGIALTDADRAGWLARLGELLAAESDVVLTCSALRRAYRDRLRAAAPDLRFAFMGLDQDAARQRVAARPGHIFPVSLVASQFQTLEDPRGEPGVLALDALQPLDQLCQQVCDWLGQSTPKD
ncbi:gluconokinase [Hylemonella sp. W303a]|uniref:gluconokinase n=1 Tax=Hylemonella sp. W303a TaxID=3389873 RepID=UPI00396B00D8